MTTKPQPAPELLKADEKAALLESSRIGRDYSWKELLQIAGFMTYREIVPGVCLFKEGESGDFVAVVTSGVLSVCKRGPGGGMIAVCDIHARQVVGEQAFLDGEPRSATVYVQAQAGLLMLRKESLDQLMEVCPRLGAKLLNSLAKEMSAKLRQTTGQMARDSCKEMLMP